MAIMNTERGVTAAGVADGRLGWWDVSCKHGEYEYETQCVCVCVGGDFYSTYT